MVEYYVALAVCLAFMAGGAFFGYLAGYSRGRGDGWQAHRRLRPLQVHNVRGFRPGFTASLGDEVVLVRDVVPEDGLVYVDRP